MKRIDRNKAIALICKNKLSSLDNDRRASLILNWWGIDEGDIEFLMLSSDLQHQILENEDPPDDIENCKYDELILIALSAKFRGATNTFIEERMAVLELGIYQVDGEIENLEICPCCNYRTLDSRGEYDICGLCNWEDNGVEENDQYSGPNHMTLGEAKKEFGYKKKYLPLGRWVKA